MSMSLTSVGIVVALKAEAAALTTRSIPPESVVRLTEGGRVWLSGMGPDAAGKGALALMDAGATALMTFGVAGALDNDLRSGALLCLSAFSTNTLGLIRLTPNGVISYCDD